MLCQSCQEVNFRPCSKSDLGTHSYILHKDDASLQLSLAHGCSLCSLINAKLDPLETHSDVCLVLQAYIVLLCSWSPRWRLRSVAVASRRGNLILDNIGDVPGQLI
jgi:hypothetical protein